MPTRTGRPTAAAASRSGGPFESRATVGDTCIRLSRVRKSYGTGPAAVRALRAIDLHVSVGELVAIAGRRGSGKTTLIELIGATQPPTAGEILVCGRRLDLLDDRGRLEFRTANVALAPQVPTLAPTLNVYETISQSARTSPQPRSDRWTHALMEAFELRAETTVCVADLSDGVQQRLSLARALAKNAPLLLIDDPLPAATAKARRHAIALMRQLVRPDTTVVLTTSDRAAAALADRVVELK
jgi:putative ABC transport system ATP-binding protein